ncbi:MAG: ABC transporter permease [Lachnospiraceae bacterium]|nr:ABC transporter permease [Lachnospiraceae bacterium]
MKSYLSLIPISAKVHKRQSRMTILCIIFSVFMVTAVFSLAEMCARMEQTRLLEKHGNISYLDLLNSTTGQILLLVSVVLFLLILIAGVLMISSSLNSTVSQKTKFFGMMRCIGMSKQQIIRFVKLEALNWCKTAVPIGIILGVVVTWGMCAILHFIVGEEFSNIPLFGISFLGIISGMLVGIITVLLAASSPAKKAAKVSPVAAVLGNSETNKTALSKIVPRFAKIETSLGIHHAISAKKNLILMTGSFALSIILFLSFSVLVDCVNYVMPQSASTADIDIYNAGSNSIEYKLVDTIGGMEGVKRVYGRRSCFKIPAELVGDGVISDTVDLISYDDFDLKCLEKDHALKKNSNLSKVYGNSNYVLATSDPSSTWKVGDKILIGNEELVIAGLLKCNPFSSNGLTNGKITLITSGKTFIRLTGITNYSLIMIQTTRNVTDKNITAIHNLVNGKYEFHDKRNQRTSGTYLAFVFCVYGFLGIIMLVTILNIINSISMSVSARIKQYGAMRAVGMDKHQIIKMIAVEAFTYAFLGCIVGGTIGVLVNKILYDQLITNHFAYAVWHLPMDSLLIIVIFVISAAVIAIYTPTKRIRSMSVTETINEL